MLRRAGVAAWALVAATLLSGTGNAVVAVAVPWLVLERTGSPALAGAVAAASFAPLVVSAFLGSALVDRWGWRRSSVGADLLSAAAVAALPLLDAVRTLDVVPVMALVALGAVFDGPGAAAREALRATVATRAGWSLERMSGRAEAAESVAGLVGPAVAGALVAAVGAMPTLWATAALLLAAAVVTAVAVPAAVPARSRRHEPYLRAVAAGVRAVLHDRVTRACALLAAGLLAVHVPLSAVVLPVHVRSDGGAGALGAVLAAGAAGGLAGALLTDRLVRGLGRRTVLLAGIAGSTAALAGLALEPGTAGTAGLVAVVGLFTGPLTPLVSVLVVERTPEALRARVLGTTTSLALAGTPLALLAAGALVGSAGVAVTALAGAALCLLAGGYAVHARVAS